MTKDYKFLNIPIMVYIFFIALFLRLYNLGLPSIWVDEAFSIWVAKSNLCAVIDYVSTDAHPPLYFILLHYWIKLFGATETSTRLLSVIFGMGTLIFIYKLCNEIFRNKKYGIISSFLFAISSFAVIYTDTDVKMYSQLMFLTTVSTYLLYKAMKKESVYPVRKPVFSNGVNLWISYIIISILNLYTHYFSFFVIFSHMLYILMARKNADGFKKVLYLIFIFLVSFIPWNNSFFEQFFISRKGEHLERSGIVNLLGLFNYFFSVINFKLHLWQSILFSVCILAVLTVGVLRCFKFEKGNIILPTFFTVLLFPFIISYMSYKHIFQSRYFSLICPLFFILIGCAVLAVKNKYLKWLIILSFATINITGCYLYLTNSKYWKQDWRTAAAYVEDKSKEGDTVLMQISYNIFPFNYYYKEGLAGIKLKDNPEGAGDLACDFIYSDEYIKKGGITQYGVDYYDEKYLNWIADNSARIIYILNFEKFYDPGRKVFKWINKNCKFIEGVELENFNPGQSHIFIGIFSKKY